MKKEKIKRFFVKTVGFLFNPRFLLCVGAAWFFTNGWAYLGLAIGTYNNIKWLIAVSGAYIAFLWIPFTPEKIVTIAIAIALLKYFFPSDQKTLGVLIRGKNRVVSEYKTRKAKRKEQKQKKERLDSNIRVDRNNS